MKHYVKKVLFLVLATMLCLSSFSGCHQAVEIDQNVDWSEITDTPTDFIFPKRPPRLIVSDGETKISAWRGTSSWDVENSDGMTSGTEMDSIYPLGCKDSLSEITVSKRGNLALIFESAPTSITVKRYRLRTTNPDAFKNIAVNDNLMDAKAGNYIYVVKATWNDTSAPYNGSAIYAFRTTR